MLGHAVLRREDPALLRGASRYVGDMTPDGTLHLAFVRSVMAHGAVEVLDTSEAAAQPGVVGVFTAADIDIAPQQMFLMNPPEVNRPMLADGVVRFVGEPIAVVAAESQGAAVDAAELVEVDYEPRPAVLDPFEALKPDAPVLLEAQGSNRMFEFATAADPADLAGHDVVVSGRIVSQRVAAAPIEPSAVLAEPGIAGRGGADDDDNAPHDGSTPPGDAVQGVAGRGDADDSAGAVTVWCTSQMPHATRDAVAGALGLPSERVRVVAPAVGGGFGAKAYVYPEFMLAAWLALRLAQPVKWVETRSENLVNMTQGRDQIHDAEMGVTREGRICWLRTRVTANVGAYPSIGAFLPMLTMLMASGPYRIPAVDFASVGAITNTPSVAAFRGAGRPEATVALERLLDLAAAELSIDPAEMRRRNLLAPGDFPFTTPTGATMDSGEYERALDLALDTARYEDLRAEQSRRRAAGDARLLGIGVSAYVEVTAVGLLEEHGSVTVEPDGTITARVGTASHGQGHATAFTQIITEVLGVPAERVRVIHSDTAEVPRGAGTAASRSLQTGGSAVWTSASRVMEQAKRLAGGLLEADPADIVAADGGLAVAGVPARTASWAELAAAAAEEAAEAYEQAAAAAEEAAEADEAGGRPEGAAPGALAAETDFNQGESSYPFGAHVCAVEVDSETGDARVVRHIAVDDCGRILNPLLVEGQVHGGVATGISLALYEESAFDDYGNPRNATFAEYAIPAASELPRYETAHTETPSPLNPLGAKGIGESGTIGSTPAVQSALIDALAPLGVTHLDMPFTPRRVWRAIVSARP